MIKYIILLLIILSGCKVSSPISDISTSHKEIHVRERVYRLEVGKRTAIDTMNLEELLTGNFITHTDKKTGVTFRHQLKGKELYTSVDIPGIQKDITLADTITTITTERKVIQEESKTWIEKLSGHFSFLVWVLVIGFVVTFVFRVLKFFFFPLI